MAAKTRVYTEGYAPPEQIVGKPEPRSDLFALAGTLYHLATGKAPEGFYTAKELETQLADPASPLPADQRWFFELIKINLAEDVNDRYFSAREIKARPGQAAGDQGGGLPEVPDDATRCASRTASSVPSR